MFVLKVWLKVSTQELFFLWSDLVSSLVHSELYALNFPDLISCILSLIFTGLISSLSSSIWILASKNLGFYLFQFLFWGCGLAILIISIFLLIRNLIIGWTSSLHFSPCVCVWVGGGQIFPLNHLISYLGIISLGWLLFLSCDKDIRK